MIQGSRLFYDCELLHVLGCHSTCEPEPKCRTRESEQKNLEHFTTFVLCYSQEPTHTSMLLLLLRGILLLLSYLGQNGEFWLVLRVFVIKMPAQPTTKPHKRVLREWKHEIVTGYICQILPDKACGRDTLQNSWMESIMHGIEWNYPHLFCKDRLDSRLLTLEVVLRSTTPPPYENGSKDMVMRWFYFPPPFHGMETYY